MLIGIFVGEGYIRVVAATAPEPSAVNHWSTHHRKEGRIQQRGDTQYYLGLAHTDTVGLTHNANIGYGESPTSWMVEWKLM